MWLRAISTILENICLILEEDGMKYGNYTVFYHDKIQVALGHLETLNECMVIK